MGDRHRSLSEDEVLVLQLLLQHRLLTALQLRELVAPDRDRTYVSRLLQPLAKRGLIDFVHARRVGARKLWWLTDRGAKALRLVGQLEERPHQVTADSAAGVLQTHTAYVNDVGISFVTTARARGDECDPLGWTHEVQHPIADRRAGATGGTVLQTDAVLQYVTSSRDAGPTLWPFFIELDAATEQSLVVVDKLRKYARMFGYVPSRGTDQGLERGASAWTATYSVFPHVLLVFAYGRRARTPATLLERLETVKRFAENDPLIKGALRDGMPVSFVALHRLTASGPTAPIFLPLTPADAPENAHVQLVDCFGQPAA